MNSETTLQHKEMGRHDVRNRKETSAGDEQSMKNYQRKEGCGQGHRIWTILMFDSLTWYPDFRLSLSDNIITQVQSSWNLVC